MKNDFRVCIVGAGPGGLSMARALLRHGIDYDQFERHSDIGGVWDQTNPGTPMYDSAHMISSRSLSGFMGYPMPNDFPDFPGHQRVLAYLHSFTDAFGLRDKIEFNRRVERAQKHDGRWVVTLDDGSQRTYDAIVAATGLAWTPRMPSYPGTFTGEMIHSQKYRSPDIFKGKRVLVIGAGNSGVDIAADASRTAAKAFLSMRRAYHFIPKHIFGMPADVFARTASFLPIKLQLRALQGILKMLNGNVRRHGLQRPDHLPLTSHPIVNSTAMHAMSHGDLTPKKDVERFDGPTVIFKDGSREDIDLIVAATGYIHSIPFVDPALLANNGQESNLFLRTIARADPTFAAVGFIEINGGVYPFYDQFSDIIANYYRELAAGTPKARHFEAIVKSGELEVAGSLDYADSPRHKVYANVLVSTTVIKKLKARMGWKPLVADDFATLRAPQPAKAVADL